MRNHQIQILFKTKGAEQGALEALVTLNERINAQDQTIRELSLLMDKLTDVVTQTTVINERLKREIEAFTRAADQGSE